MRLYIYETLSTTQSVYELFPNGLISFTPGIGSTDRPQSSYVMVHSNPHNYLKFESLYHIIDAREDIRSLLITVDSDLCSTDINSYSLALFNRRSDSTRIITDYKPGQSVVNKGTLAAWHDNKHGGQAQRDQMPGNNIVLWSKLSCWNIVLGNIICVLRISKVTVVRDMYVCNNLASFDLLNLIGG